MAREDYYKEEYPPVYFIKHTEEFKNHTEQDHLKFEQILNSQDDLKKMVETNHGELRENLEEIKKQTQKTNGHVADLKQWQAFVKGGLSILTILVVPILIYIIKQLL